MSGEKDFEFEAALAELEQIVEQLDREGLGLDQAIDLFERGIARLGEAREWLDTASGRIEQLIATSTGKLEATPLTDLETSDGRAEEVDADDRVDQESDDSGSG